MTEEEWVPTQEFICRGERTPKGVAIMFDKVYGEIVRCKDCKHRPVTTDDEDIMYEFPDHICPCQCEDTWYSWMSADDWFCADGERKES